MTHQGKKPERPEEPLSPVAQVGQQVWNERWLLYRNTARTWQGVALIATAIAGVSVLSAMHMAGQSKLVPFVVEVNKLGETVAARALEQTIPTDPRVIKAQLAEWVVDMRTVLVDQQAQVTAFRRGYAWIDAGSPASQVFADWFNENTTRERAIEGTVAVEIETVSPESASSWRVNWREQKFSLKGEKDGPPTYWFAILGVVQNPPTTEAAILANPIGLYIETLKWGDRPAGVVR